MCGGAVPRKRDRFRNLLGISSKTSATPTIPTQSSASSPAQAAQSPGAPPSQISRPTDPSQKLQDDALRLLGSKERETVKKHVVHSTRDVNTAVIQAYTAALIHKRKCEKERWQWTFRGRTVVMRDEADKVLQWLDRFKPIGDIVANVDPVHIGLPWAGIRMLLEIGAAESRQMGALLVGMDLALYMANRLKVYFDFFKRLPSALATTNLEIALVEMYAHILRFIATAIQTYETDATNRTWRALWQTPSLEDFESECDKLGQRAEIEASNCDRELSKHNWADAKRWRDDLQNMLKNLDQVQGISTSLSRLHVKADLAKLVAAQGATHNSHAEEGFAECFPGTRTQLLRQIAEWADDPNGKCIFWLCGKAGTGKSTISRTVAYDLDKQQRLGASFFFKRGEGDRGNASRFFATIVAQLADIIPGLSSLIAVALEKDSFLSERSLQDQFEKLMSQPLADLMQAQVPPSCVFIVIDALDECELDGSIKKILSLLARLEATTSLRLRIFVTSRPELLIKSSFAYMSRDLHEDIMLEEVQASTIEHDLRIYFKYRLDEIKVEDSEMQLYDPLPVDWPGDDNITAMVNLAVPLFVFAFTICRYISESDPRGRLQAILQQRQNVSLSGLEKTYVPILNQLTLGKDQRQQERIVAEFREVAGSIVLLADPLSAPSLSRLLKIPLRTIMETLNKLHSVLNIPTNHDAPIRLFHLSFRDFLVDLETKAQNRFWINEAETHRRLAQKCLLLLTQPENLKLDLCGVEKPGCRRSEVSKQQVADSITADVAYACRCVTR